MVLLMGCLVYQWLLSKLWNHETEQLAVKDCLIGGFTTTDRKLSSKVSALFKISSASASTVCYGTIELDSHADTIVFGRNFVSLGATGRECTVSPYTDAYEAISNVPIVSAATAWTSPSTGVTYILVCHEGLWMGDKMENSLLNPNQLRHYGVIVQDNPFSDSPLYMMSHDHDFYMPLKSSGCIVMAETRTPTARELQLCQRITLSSQHPWDPHTIEFPLASRSVEEEIVFQEEKRMVGAFSISSVASCAETDVSDSDSDDGCGCSPIYNLDKVQRRLISSVKVHDVPPVRQVSAVENDFQQDLPTLPTFQSKERHTSVTAQDLSERWCISLHQAKETLKRTTQRIVRSALLPLGRRYRADRMFEKPRLRGDWFTDTMDGRVKSRDGNRYGQVFANKNYFAAFYPMDSKSKAGEALREFTKEFGVPDRLIFDGSGEQTGKNTEFMKQIRKNDIDYHVIEPERHNQNPAEGVIRELRRKWFRIMIRKRVPRRFWDYGARWVAEIMQRTATSAGRMDDAIPIELVTGDTTDISEYLDFGFYDKVSYRENAGLGETKYGRWLGVSHKVGSLMAYYVLTDKCTVISRTTVQRVTALEDQTEEFDAEIKLKLNEDDYPVQGDKASPEDWAAYVDYDEDFQKEFDFVVSNENVAEADADFSPDVYDDTYLNMELAVPRDGDGPDFARVTKRLRDANGLPIGLANDNPILDTRMYEVEYLDGHKASLTANAIAQNLFAQVDEEGNRHVLMDEIVDHRTDGTAVTQQEAFVTTKTGTRRRRQTTKGWEILVRWKDGSTTWVALKDMKEEYPVQVAEYAVQSKISMEPAFAWWCPWVLKKRNRIIGKVKSKYWLRTHKFGIRIPKTVKEALELDRESGNTLWWDAVCKEMKNVRIAFEAFEGEATDIAPGYQEIRCHMIFDVKMGENFRRKARMVADGHRTETPTSITYSSVVSRDSVRIALTIAALNGLDVLSCDIQNAYLTAPCREKVWTRAGPEFGSEQGQIMLVV